MERNISNSRAVNSPRKMKARSTIPMITRSFRRIIIPETGHRTARTKASPEQRPHVRKVFKGGWTRQIL
jgi:hypothetical protein